MKNEIPSISEAIRIVRESNKWTRLTLASRSDISVSTISQAECGRTRCSNKTISALSAATGIRVDVFTFFRDGWPMLKELSESDRAIATAVMYISGTQEAIRRR